MSGVARIRGTDQHTGSGTPWDFSPVSKGATPIPFAANGLSAGHGWESGVCEPT